MPFLGLATSGDLEKLKNEISENTCTMLVNGVHICDHAKYQTNMKDPEDLTMNDILFQDTDFCVKFDHLPDITGMPLNNMVGHGDIPDHYICFEKGKVDQYVQSLMPAQQYNMMTQNETIMNTKLRDAAGILGTQENPADQQSPVFGVTDLPTNDRAY